MSAVAERIRPRAARKEAPRRETPPAQDTLTLVKPDGTGTPLRLSPFKLESLAPQDRVPTSPFSEKGITCPSCDPDARSSGKVTVLLDKSSVLKEPALQVESLKVSSLTGGRTEQMGDESWRKSGSCIEECCVGPTKENPRSGCACP